MKDELTIICSKEFEYYEDMYKVIDFLNKNLQDKNIIFGVALKNGKHILTIYNEE